MRCLSFFHSFNLMSFEAFRLTNMRCLHKTLVSHLSKCKIRLWPTISNSKKKNICRLKLNIAINRIYRKLFIAKIYSTNSLCAFASILFVILLALFQVFNFHLCIIFFVCKKWKLLLFNIVFCLRDELKCCTFRVIQLKLFHECHFWNDFFIFVESYFSYFPIKIL